MATTYEDHRRSWKEHRDSLYTYHSTGGKNNLVFLDILADLTNSNQLVRQKIN